MIIECHNCKAAVDAESKGFVEEEDLFWFIRTHILQCPICKCAIVGTSDSEGVENGATKWSRLTRVYPKPRRLLSFSVPETVKISLDEAEKCMQAGAYVAAAAMAGRALEALCRHLGTKETYLGAGIKELKDKGIIDTRLHQWSEELRDARNEAAHATDKKFSHQDTEDLLAFTYAIVDYVFLLTEKFSQFQERKKKNAEKKKRANQSLQTMTTAVTCRAAHAPRQLRSCLI